MKHLKFLNKAKNKLPNYYALIYILICIVLGSVYIFKKDIYFFTDISRDFLLMEEVLEKKLVLIGPRASAIKGLFHGPLWVYLNIPAYVIGKRNPVFVGWSWVIFSLVYVLCSYNLVKEVTSKKISTVYTLFLAGQIIPWIYGLYNPLGAMMLIPALIYSSLKFLKKGKAKYLALALFTNGLIIQLQMAVGVPLLILNSFAYLGKIIKTKRLKQLLSFFILAIPLSTFLIFDLRHDFIQIKSVLNFLSDKTDVKYYTYLERLNQRLFLIKNGGLGTLINSDLTKLSFTSMVVVLATLLLPKSSKYKHRKALRYLLYLFFGYFSITLLFNGELLLWYWLPVVPIFLLALSISLTYYPKIISRIFIGVVLLAYINFGIDHAKQSVDFVGKVEDSWQFQSNLAKHIFTDGEEQFGYFIFTPDIYAYESKAAMSYYTYKYPEKLVSIYKKQPVTYLIIAPDPAFRPDISSSHWKNNRVKIYEEPDEITHFTDGYTIEKYNLDEEQLNIKEDPTLHDWLYFR